MKPVELAALAGVSTDTLRHYERLGLLAPPGRTAAGHRRYQSEALERVRLIQGALAIGFSLPELARVLTERERGGTPCRAVRALVATRLSDLEQELTALADLKRHLEALLRTWDTRLSATPAGRQARLLDTLSGAVPVRARRRRGVTRRP